MKKWELYRRQRETVRKLGENIYLFAFMAYIIQEFLRYTMFPIDWNAPFGCLTFLNHAFIWFFDTPQYFLTGLVLIRMLCFKTYDRRYFLASAGILICAYYAWTNNHMIDILFWAMMIIGAKEIPLKKIVKLHLILLAVLLVITNFSAIFGVIDNVYYERSGNWKRFALGMTYPTNYAAYIFYAILYYWYYIGKKITYIEIGITGVMGIFVLIVSGARCSFICLMITVLFMILYKRKVQTRALSSLLSVSMTVCAVLMMGMTIFYSSENAVMEKINGFLSDRLLYGKKGVDIYGFHIWGQAISINGNGEGKLAGKYFFLDSSYMMIVIMYGIVILGLILLVFYAIGCQARKNGEWILLWILALIAIHSMVEQHLLEISNCSFILAVFAERRSCLCRTRTKLEKESQ